MLHENFDVSTNDDLPKDELYAYGITSNGD
jgi:hypothetical protein